MRKFIRLAGCLLFLNTAVVAQNNIAINTSGAAAATSAILDLNSGNAGNKGFLPQKVNLTATNAAGPVASPATGLQVYNMNTTGVSPTNVFPGYFFWNGSWVCMNTETKVSCRLPFLNISSAPFGNFYTSAYTPCPTAPTTSCSTAYNAPLVNAPVSNLNSILSVTYWGTYNNSFYTLGSNGNFSRAYGWINSGTVGTVTVYAYVYSLTNNSNAALSGTQIGSSAVTITTAGRNYYFEVNAASPPFALTKGQMLILWYYPSVGMTNLFATGIVEATSIPQ